MRLINCSETIKFDKIIFECFDGNTPAYAILSHTWEIEELTLQGVLYNENVSKLRGYQKVIKTCQIAVEEGIKYAWADTCCIDKTSSAELSEAINSMYRWYEKAKLAIAFISDWKTDVGESTLERCRWFTRGWTLQELIAPREMSFYDSNWTLCGTKTSMVKELSRITGISAVVLNDAEKRFRVPSCVKMSWAAHRQTTREEDMAYCLIGLFDINMPLLYGEGSKAFLRLQELIISRSRDATIFAWRASPGSKQRYRGLFARKPAEFAESSEVSAVPISVQPQEWILTNIGIRTTTMFKNRGAVLALNALAQVPNDSRRYPLGIYLRRTDSGTFVRDRPREFGQVEHTTFDRAPSTVYIETEFSEEKSQLLEFVLSSPIPTGSGVLKLIFTRDSSVVFSPILTEPSDRWDPAENVFSLRRDGSIFVCVATRISGVVERQLQSAIFWLFCDVDPYKALVWATLATQETHQNALSYYKELYLLRPMVSGGSELHEINVKSVDSPGITFTIALRVRPWKENKVPGLTQLFLHSWIQGSSASLSADCS